MKTCLNCGKAVENKYCSACGQRSDTGRLSWKNLWEDIVRGLLQLDYQFDETCPEGLMVKGRNEQWTPILSDILKEKNCFVAVGLFHLTRDCGLIVKLREAGYSVEPITDLL